MYDCDPAHYSRIPTDYSNTACGDLIHWSKVYDN